MVNRRKSPLVEKERKLCYKLSKDSSTFEDVSEISKGPQKNCDKKDFTSPEQEILGECERDNQEPGTSGTCGNPVTIQKSLNNDGAKEDSSVKQTISHQIATRSVTGRLTKRLRSYSPAKSPPPTKKQAKDVPKSGTNNPPASGGTPEIKTRKQWEQWSIQDKDLFFEALYEHGKDFEAIQQSISQKLKKRDPTCAVRTKDHIRHFYYRTWHKLTKCIDSEGIDDCNKQALELYGLINYGELRKRIGSKLDEKTGQKLNELVHKGATAVKVKQKNHRIKTPSCRALKKLHQIEDHKEEERTKMPDKIVVELFPHTNTAWAEVQSLAQNPRLRVTVRLGKRVSSLVEFLNRKWTSDRVRMKEQLKEPETSTQEIKISVPEGSKLHLIQVKQTPSTQKLELSFKSYIESLKGQQQTLISPTPNRKVQKSILSNLEDLQIQQPSCSTSDLPADGVQDNQVSSTDELSSTKDSGLSPLLSANDKAQDGMRSRKNSVCSVKSERMESIVSHQFDESAIPFSSIVSDKEFTHIKDEEEKDTEANADTDSKLQQQELDSKEKLLRLEKGFLFSECGNITIAEVYMMMGCPAKLSLEYEWVEKKVVEDIWELNKKLTNMLRRLVHLATTEFIDFKKVKPLVNKSPTKCMCGARNSGTPPGSNKVANGRGSHINSPLASRVRLNRSPSTPKNTGRGDLRPLTPKSEDNQTHVAPNTPTSSKRQVLAISPDKPGNEMPPLVVPSLPTPDNVFKMPTSMPPRVQQVRPILPNPEQSHLLQQINMVQRQTDYYVPKSRHGQRRIQRNIRRPLVVQRTLLPKADSPGRQIMTLAMVPVVSMAGQTASFLPIMSSNSSFTTVQSVTCTSSPINAVAVTQDFGVPQLMTTAKGKVTTMSITSVNKATAVRRIIPTPVTDSSEGSSVFAEAPEIGISTSNILKEAAMAAKIEEPNSPMPLENLDESVGLHTPPHGELSITSRTGDEPIDPPSFSQSFTLSAAGTILGRSSLHPNLSSTSTSAANLSTYLDISVPSVADISESSDNKMMDLDLLNSNSSFGGLAGDKDASLSSLLNTGDDVTPLSPSKGFKGLTSDQWLGPGGESLSSFLQDTPKKSQTEVATTATTTSCSVRHFNRQAAMAQPFVLGESSRDSIILGNVETTFEVMMNENSMDYMSKFADLAAHINGVYQQESQSLRKNAEIVGEKTS